MSDDHVVLCIEMDRVLCDTRKLIIQTRSGLPVSCAFSFGEAALFAARKHLCGAVIGHGFGLDGQRKIEAVILSKHPELPVLKLSDGVIDPGLIADFIDGLECAKRD